MFEVEAKVPLTKGEYKSLKSRLQKEGEYMGKKKNEDSYYEKLKKATIRIRKRGPKYSFDLKFRKTIDGIESNIEMEWKLKDQMTWRKLLSKLDIKPYIKKTKKTELFKLDGFLVELNEIRNLGYYMEIEKIIKNPKEVNKAKKDLIQVFRKLGYSKKDFEPKRYLELLLANV